MLSIDEVNKLQEENIRVKTAFNNLIMEIISDVEFTGEIVCNGETPLEHLHRLQSEHKKYKKALEKIKKLAETGSEQEDCYSCEEIIFEIDEVMG